ncbi:MAG TPA: glycosyltransferase [Gaiellaceae bacterium]|nr:glycosyltransferase [Gaiellaceae bacterium]
MESYRAARTLVLDALAGRADRAAAAGRALAYLEEHPAEPFLLNATGVLLHELGRGGRPLVEAALRLDPALPGAAANLAGMAPGDDPRQAAVAARALPATAQTLTLCLIVRDEEELLPACLAAAAPQADEVVVVDTGSTDGTVAIARSYGARVLEVPWEGSFSPPKNVALAAAHGDWVLFLDADEQLQDDVRPLLACTWREAFLLPMTNLVGDGSDASTHPALRLWRSRRGYRFAGRVHERLEGLPLDLPERLELAETGILHLGYLDRHVARRAKTERNLALLAQEAPGPYTAFNRGSEHARAGDWTQAASSFDEALAELGPGWRHVGYGTLLAARAARARRETGRVAEARALLEEALREAPDYTDLAYELACCAVEAGDRVEAAGLLRRCLAQGDAPAAYLGRAGAGSFLARELLHLLGEDDPIKTEPISPIHRT